MSLLRELHRAGSTICMVTHDPRYAEFADHGRLFDGRIVEESAESAKAGWESPANGRAGNPSHNFSPQIESASEEARWLCCTGTVRFCWRWPPVI
jgi:ABC-type multidrug transport system ATPase subunit